MICSKHTNAQRGKTTSIQRYWSHFVSLCFVLVRFGSFFVSVRSVSLWFACLRRGISFRVVFVSRFVSLRFASFRFVSLHYVTLRYVTLRYVTLRYVTLCYVSFRFVPFRFVSSFFVSFRSVSTWVLGSIISCSSERILQGTYEWIKRSASCGTTSSWRAFFPMTT